MKTTFLLLLLATAALAQPPYQPTALWQREGAGDSSLYGSEILALGDQNGDGLNDWAVYAAGRGWAEPGTPNEPKVEFFHGGNPPASEPYMVRVKDPATEVSVRGAKALGDLNGDGFVDWGIFTNDLTVPEHPPITKVYHGGPDSDEVPDLTIPITWAYPIGDFNGDGYDDIYLSAWVILFGGDPMDILPDWGRSSSLGFVNGSGDVNHDGFADFVAANNSIVAIYFGGANPDTLPAHQWQITSYFPAVVTDMGGDGYDDICLDRTGGTGWGQVIWGGTTIDTTQYAHLNFPCEGSRPMNIVSAGDFNADGFGDVVMLREYCPDWYYGTLTLHLGGRWISGEVAFSIDGWTAPLNLIHFKTAVSVGDVNGDSVDDLAVGANGGPEHAGWRGKAVVLQGDDSLIAATNDPWTPLPQTLTIAAYPNPFNSSTTICLSLPAYQDRVDLTLYNVLGQLIRKEGITPFSTGVTYPLDASDLPAGLYLLQVTSGTLSTTTKLMLLK